jgi:hypothetical protein
MLASNENLSWLFLSHMIVAKNGKWIILQLKQYNKHQTFDGLLEHVLQPIRCEC